MHVNIICVSWYETFPLKSALSTAGSSALEFDAEMLQILVCPLSKAPLRQAPRSDLMQYMGAFLLESKHAKMSGVLCESKAEN